MTATWPRLLAAAARQGAGHLVLVDPDRTDADRAGALARECDGAGVDAILIGSSTPPERDPAPVLEAVRRATALPLVLFPGSADQLRPGADAVLFLSLLSGRDARFLAGEQVRGAPRVMAWGLEPIPTGYLLVGDAETSSVARVTGTRPLPLEPAESVVAHAQAAACLGMSLVYLEGGSGAANPVPTSLVRLVSRAVPIPVAVGGGVRHPADAAALVAAGARFVVTGTVHERGLPVRPFCDAVHGAMVAA